MSASITIFLCCSEYSYASFTMSIRRTLPWYSLPRDTELDIFWFILQASNEDTKAVYAMPRSRVESLRPLLDGYSRVDSSFRSYFEARRFTDVTIWISGPKSGRHLTALLKHPQASNFQWVAYTFSLVVAPPHIRLRNVHIRNSLTGRVHWDEHFVHALLQCYPSMVFLRMQSPSAITANGLEYLQRSPTLRYISFTEDVLVQGTPELQPGSLKKCHLLHATVWVDELGFPVEYGNPITVLLSRSGFTFHSVTLAGNSPAPFVFLPSSISHLSTTRLAVSGNIQAFMGISEFRSLFPRIRKLSLGLSRGFPLESIRSASLLRDIRELGNILGDNPSNCISIQYDFALRETVHTVAAVSLDVLSLDQVGDFVLLCLRKVPTLSSISLSCINWKALLKVYQVICTS